MAEVFPNDQLFGDAPELLEGVQTTRSAYAHNLDALSLFGDLNAKRPDLERYLEACNQAAAHLATNDQSHLALFAQNEAEQRSLLIAEHLSPERSGKIGTIDALAGVAMTAVAFYKPHWPYRLEQYFAFMGPGMIGTAIGRLHPAGQVRDHASEPPFEAITDIELFPDLFAGQVFLEEMQLARANEVRRKSVTIGVATGMVAVGARTYLQRYGI